MHTRSYDVSENDLLITENVKDHIEEMECTYELDTLYLFNQLLDYLIENYSWVLRNKEYHSYVNAKAREYLEEYPEINEQQKRSIQHWLEHY